MIKSKENILSFLSDIIIGLFILIFCVFFYFQSTKLSYDAKVFPISLLFCLAICSFCLIFPSIYKICNLKEKRERINEQVAIFLSWEYLRVECLTIIFYLLVVFYIIILPFIGFEYSSAIFLFFGMWLINGKPFFKNYYYYCIIILMPIIFVLLFRVVLKVTLPYSNIPFNKVLHFFGL